MKRGYSDIREPLDQRELMRDLAALGLDLLLRVLKLLGGGLGLESDLSNTTSVMPPNITPVMGVVCATYVVCSRHLGSVRVVSCSCVTKRGSSVEV